MMLSTQMNAGDLKISKINIENGFGVQVVGLKPARSSAALTDMVKQPACAAGAFAVRSCCLFLIGLKFMILLVADISDHFIDDQPMVVELMK